MCHKRLSVRFITTVRVLFISLIVGVNAVCENGFFDSSSGCKRCPEHCKFCYFSSYCLSCENGFSGTTCQFSCDNCRSHTECTKDNGFCVQDCREGLSGTRCDKACESRCRSCDRDNSLNCLTCKENQTCKLTCPCVKESCTESFCSEGCSKGYWGDSCQHNCPPECNSGGCRRENGTCPEEPASTITFATIMSVVLLITAGGIIFIVFRKRRLRSREENARQQNADESQEAQTMYSEPNDISSEQHNYLNPIENNESSFNYLTNSANDDRHLYEKMQNPNYIPLSTNKRLEDQYQHVTTNVSQAQVTEHEQCEKMDS